MDCYLFTCSKREKETHLYLLCSVGISWIRHFIMDIPSLKVLKQTYICKPAAFMCPLCLSFLSFSFHLPFFSAPSILLCPLSANEGYMDFVYINYRHGLHGSLKEPWDRFIYIVFVHLESWLYRRNHFSSHIKLWWKHGHMKLKLDFYAAAVPSVRQWWF